MTNAFLAWLLAGAAAAATPSPSLTPFEVLPGATQPSAASERHELETTRDPFERLTVEVTVGQSRPYRFLVDTGADRTSVSNEVADELGLAQRNKALLHSASGATMVRTAHLPEIRMNKRSVHNITAPMLDASAIGADGILGVDSLRSQQVVFDFNKGAITIYSGRGPGPIDKNAVVVKAKRRDGRLILTQASIQGHKVGVVLDTGASLSIGNLAMRADLANRGMLRSIGPIDLMTVTGEPLTGELAVVDNLRIGGVTLAGLSIVFADAHAFRQLKMDRKPAMLLGMNALRGFDQVGIDFADRRLSLVPPRKRSTLPV